MFSASPQPDAMFNSRPQFHTMGPSVPRGSRTELFKIQPELSQKCLQEAEDNLITQYLLKKNVENSTEK